MFPGERINEIGPTIRSCHPIIASCEQNVRTAPVSWDCQWAKLKRQSHGPTVRSDRCSITVVIIMGSPLNDDWEGKVAACLLRPAPSNCLILHFIIQLHFFASLLPGATFRRPLYVLSHRTLPLFRTSKFAQLSSLRTRAD
jgi:hypothetical protein